MVKRNNMKIILGSKSPRRKELIEGLGFDYVIRTKDTDESYPTDLATEKVAEYIAKKKAEALILDLVEDELLLCADTVVIVDNEILGKPNNEVEAIEMIAKLSGKTHDVTTGVALYSNLKKHSFSVTTKVTFKHFTNEEIEFYVSHYKPFDKAGGYGIQEWIGYIGVTELKGSYFNVVGLPTAEVYEAISRF